MTTSPEYSFFKLLTSSTRPEPLSTSQVAAEPWHRIYHKAVKGFYCLRNDFETIRLWCDAIYSTKDVAIPDNWPESTFHTPNPLSNCITPVVSYFEHIISRCDVVTSAESAGNSGTLTFQSHDSKVLKKIQIRVIEDLRVELFDKDVTNKAKKAPYNQQHCFWWLTTQARANASVNIVILTDGTNNLVMYQEFTLSPVRFCLVECAHPSAVLAACGLWLLVDELEILKVSGAHFNSRADAGDGIGNTGKTCQRTIEPWKPRLLKVGDQLHLSALSIHPRFNGEHYQVKVPAATEAQVDQTRRKAEEVALCFRQLQEGHSNSLKVFVQRLVRVGRYHAQLAFCALGPDAKPTFCVKIYDDAFYPRSYDEDMETDSETDSRTQSSSDQTIHSPIDVATNEFYAYERLSFCQGAVIPWCYGTFNAEMPDGRRLPGVALEALVQPNDAPARTLRALDIQEWDHAAKMDLLKQLRFIARVLRYASVEYPDMTPDNILVAEKHQSDALSILLVDFGGTMHHDRPNPTLTRPAWETYGSFHFLIVDVIGRDYLDHWWSEPFRLDQLELPVYCPSPKWLVSGVGAEPSTDRMK